MIGVVVRGERADEPHAVGLQRVESPWRVVRGIDDDGFARLAVADEVHEVDHLLSDEVVFGEVETRQQLPEVDPVGGGCGWR